MIRQMGFIKHGFVMSFYYLALAAKREISFYDSIKEICSLAGDSDTNGCIAGAMVGAIVGFKKIDQNMVKVVLSCDVTGEGQKRPECFSVGK